MIKLSTWFSKISYIFSLTLTQYRALFINFRCFQSFIKRFGY